MERETTPLCRRPARSLRSAQHACDNLFMTDNALIDRFVETLNGRGFESLPEQEVPPELRVGVPNDFGWCNWKMCAVGSNPWVAGLEQSLAPYRFPILYLSLISRYRFAEFEADPILFLANTGQGVFHELADCIHKDPVMSPVLLKQGLLQFARPDSVRYDPICFAAAKMKNGDAPIVQIDHEDILSFNRKGRIVAEIAPSFRRFVEQVIAGEMA